MWYKRDPMNALVLARTALAALVTLVTVDAAAEEKAATDRAGVQYSEVERGVRLGTGVGAIFYFSVPGEGAATSYGSLLGIEAGYDPTDSLSLAVIAYGQSVGADATYKGIDDDAVDPKRARGDFHSTLVGGSARWLFASFADDNGTARTHLYARAAGGIALSRPVGVVEEQGYFVLAGPGVEYFTRLRHFSVGLETDLSFVMLGEGNAVGLAVLPHLAYSF